MSSSFKVFCVRHKSFLQFLNIVFFLLEKIIVLDNLSSMDPTYFDRWVRLQDLAKWLGISTVLNGDRPR